jgi:AcrR family transcriptional regulator
MTRHATPYHHGTLREALIEATEGLLAERGADGFSLREVARRAGVSPAAPAHHFGDAAGLLTAVATAGFAGLTDALERGDARGAGDPRAALREQGLAYVRFALRHPGRFRLMFRSQALHAEPALLAQADAAFEVLARGVRALWGVPDAAAMQPLHWQAVLGMWSLVHGYAHLAIAGKFDGFAGGAPPDDFLADMVAPMLEASLDGLVARGAAAGHGGKASAALSRRSAPACPAIPVPPARPRARRR